MTPDRDQLLALDDAALLRHCRQEFFRVSGPGGQHRNRTDSAVRLVLAANPAIGASAVERRSQHQNRAQAVARLRLAIAYGWRRPAPPAPLTETRVNPEHPRYARLVAVVLDALDQHAFEVRPAALTLGLGTAQLSKLLARDPRLLGFVNQARQQRGLRLLRPG